MAQAIRAVLVILVIRVEEAPEVEAGLVLYCNGVTHAPITIRVQLTAVALAARQEPLAQQPMATPEPLEMRARRLLLWVTTSLAVPVVMVAMVVVPEPLARPALVVLMVFTSQVAHAVGTEAMLVSGAWGAVRGILILVVVVLGVTLTTVAVAVAALA